MSTIVRIAAALMFAGIVTVTENANNERRGTFVLQHRDTFTRGAGKSRQTYTRIVLFVNNQTSAYLALYQESVFSKIGKFFGMQDVQVGDEDFDRRFIIKSRPENYVVGLLMTGDLRQKLLEARSVNIELDGRELHFEQIGFLTKQDYLRSVFDLLSDVAGAIERVGGGPAEGAPAWGS